MNSKRIYTLAVWSLLAICASLRVMHANASLGESVDSVDMDRQAFSVLQKTAPTRRAGYSIEEIATGGATIREYVSKSGVVFGVAWNGRKPPDLNLLLGGYANEYASVKASTARTHGRQPLALQTDHLVVESWGHMRNLQGHAYDPTLLPAGVSAHDIQ